MNETKNVLTRSGEPDLPGSPQHAATNEVIAALVRTYMAEHMAMSDPAEDQEQNWIYGHMVAFAVTLSKRKGF